MIRSFHHRHIQFLQPQETMKITYLACALSLKISDRNDRKRRRHGTVAFVLRDIVPFEQWSVGKNRFSCIALYIAT